MDGLHYSTGLFESSRLALWLTLTKDGSEICKTDRDHKNIKIGVAAILCNAFIQLK